MKGNWWNTVKDVLTAMVKGDLLLRLRLERFFMHIAFVFLLLWASILIGLGVESSLVEVEKNAKILSDMKIYHAQKTVQLVSLDRLSVVEDLLEKNGSDLAIPESPADRIDN